MSRAGDADRKEACGYTPANKWQDNCKGCSRVTYEVRDPDTAYERRDMKCRLHKIHVSHGSICEDWEKAK